jgi:hypothetical protein
MWKQDFSREIYRNLPTGPSNKTQANSGGVSGGRKSPKLEPYINGGVEFVLKKSDKKQGNKLNLYPAAILNGASKKKTKNDKKNTAIFQA